MKEESSKNQESTTKEASKDKDQSAKTNTRNTSEAREGSNQTPERPSATLSAQSASLVSGLAQEKDEGR